MAQFVDIPWTSDTGAVKAECATGSVEEPVTFSDANTKLEHGTAVVTDTLNWPTWSSYPPGTDAPTNPTLAVTAGTYPAPGTVITGSTTYQYTWTVSNLVYCVTDAPVRGEATICMQTCQDAALKMLLVFHALHAYPLIERFRHYEPTADGACNVCAC